MCHWRRAKQNVNREDTIWPPPLHLRHSIDGRPLSPLVARMAHTQPFVHHGPMATYSSVSIDFQGEEEKRNGNNSQGKENAGTGYIRAVRHYDAE